MLTYFKGIQFNVMYGDLPARLEGKKALGDDGFTYFLDDKMRSPMDENCKLLPATPIRQTGCQVLRGGKWESSLKGELDISYYLLDAEVKALSGLAVVHPNHIEFYTK